MKKKKSEDVNNIEDISEEMKDLDESFLEDEDEILNTLLQDEDTLENENSDENLEMDKKQSNSNKEQEKKTVKNENKNKSKKDKNNNIDNPINNMDSENKKTETIFSKRVEIPLVGLILTILIFIIIIISLVMFKDKIFNINIFQNINKYSKQLNEDNKLNEEEKIGFDLVSKWLDTYKSNSLDVKSRIFSYNINSVSLNSKKDNKFIIMANYDVSPASLDNSIWINNNGEKENNKIKNKSQYFVIEKINDEYAITSTSFEQPDINNYNIAEEKAILIIKDEFPDKDNLNLSIDSTLIDDLEQSKKDEILSNIGESLDNFYTITGTYRNTYILGTILVDKNTQEKWFVDVDGITSKIEKTTQILNLAKFEVQGDTTMTKEQALLVALSSFSKNKRQAVYIQENWIDTIQNIEQAKQQLGDLEEYYAFKPSTYNGFILIKKNGLAKYYIKQDGTIIDILQLDDITDIL